MLCSYFIPPLGIFWQYGCGLEFVICVILTMLGYIPGVVYAIFMVAFDDGH